MNILIRNSVALSISVVLLAVIGLTGYRAIRRLVDANAWVSHTHEVVKTIEAVMSQLKDAETAQRGYLLTGLDSYLEPYRSATAEVGDLLATAKGLTADNPAQQERLDRVERSTGDKLLELKETIDLYAAGEREPKPASSS